MHRRGYRFARRSPGDGADADAPLVHAAATRRRPGPRRVPVATPAPPITRYAHSRDVNIAYQVIGDGASDIVFVMGWVSHLDYFWAEPSFAAFLRRLASFGRLILFDKRGTGLSDRVPACPRWSSGWTTSAR